MHLHFVDIDTNVTLIGFVDIQLCLQQYTQMYKTDMECYSRFRNGVLPVLKIRQLYTTVYWLYTKFANELRSAIILR